MIDDEEQLPLYIHKEKIKSKNIYKYNDKRQQRDTKNYNEKYIYKSAKDNKKLIPIKNTHKIINYIRNFISILFNNKEQKVFYFFILLIIAEYLEYFFDTFIDLFSIKFVIFIIFLIPFLIIILDNQFFFELNSYFELNFLIFLKLIILFNKKMNFIEIFFISISANLFEILFIKKIHMNQYYFSLDGYLDKLSYKINVFESEFNFIIFGFIFNFATLSYLLINEKLSFFLFDDVFTGLGINYKIEYFFLLGYLFLRKFIKYIIKYIFIYDEKYKNKKKSKIIKIFFCIFVTIIFIYINILFKSFSEKVSNTLFILLIIFIYENIGILLYGNLILLSFIILLVDYYIKSNFTDDITFLIKNNFKYINISFLLSIVFIISIFILEKKRISNFYIKLYYRIFLIKIIFDLWLMLKYIYSLYKFNPSSYFNIFLQSYKLFFSFFLINYFLIFLFILTKLYIYINPKDIDNSFDEIILFLDKKKLDKEVFYGDKAPYLEIKFYKTCKKFFSFLNEDISKNSKKTKAFQKILYTLISFIFVFLTFIINNSVLFFPIFFIILQFCSDFINNFTFMILNNFCFIMNLISEGEENRKYKKYKEDYMIQKYHKKIMKQRIFNKLKKEKFKLIYILSFFYIYLFIKNILSRIFIYLYENIIFLIQYKIFGKLEPLGSIIYQFIIMDFYNEKNTKNLFQENIFIFLFLIPNSLIIIKSHYYNRKIPFFFQNYILSCLLPYFFQFDFSITFLGLLNIFLMINLFFADTSTYNAYKFWFFLFGIQANEFTY